MRRKLHSLAVIVIGAIGCASSETVPSSDLLREAEQRCLDAQFVNAEPLLRAYLRQDPENAVAHYYLGRCYLSDDLKNLTLARGEITAALSLFANHGQASPGARFTDEYFELMCLADIGKTYLSEIAMIISRSDIPMPGRIREVKRRIALCEALAERAKRVNPRAELTTWLRMRTEEVTASIVQN